MTSMHTIVYLYARDVLIVVCASLSGWSTSVQYVLLLLEILRRHCEWKASGWFEVGN